MYTNRISNIYILKIHKEDWNALERKIISHELGISDSSLYKNITFGGKRKVSIIEMLSWHSLWGNLFYI